MRNSIFKNSDLQNLFIILSIFAFLCIGCGGGGGDGGGGVAPATGSGSTQAINDTLLAIMGLGDSKLTTDQNPVAISGLASASDGITRVEFVNESNGQTGDATGTTEWSANIELVEGDNKLKFIAVSNDDNEREIETVITYYPVSAFNTPFKLSEDLIFVNEPEEVVFTIGVNSETVETVTLYATQKDGTIKSEEGTCIDDGVLPDEIVNDGIYTIKISLSSSENEYLCFRVGVTETDGDSYYSENRCIRVVEHFADADINTAVELANSANDIYDQAINEGNTYQEAAEIIVNQLKSHPDIAGIIATDVGGVSWITTVGILGGYHPVEYDLQEAEAEVLLSAGNSDERQDNAFEVAGFWPFSSNDRIQSSKAIIISPYYADFKNKGWDHYITVWPTIRDKNSSRLYAAEERINDDDPAWNLDKFKNLSDFGHINICSHGKMYRFPKVVWDRKWGDYIENGQGDQVVGLWTRIRITKKSDGTFYNYEKDLHQKRIAIMPDGIITILPKFIKDYVHDLPNSVVFLSTCYSLHNDTMAYAFYQSGAGAVVGYPQVTSLGKSGPIARIVTEELYKDKTVREGLEKAKVDEDYEHVKFFGNDDLKLPELLYPEVLYYEGKGILSHTMTSTRPSQTQGTITCKQKIKWRFTFKEDGTLDAEMDLYGGQLHNFCHAPSYCDTPSDTIEDTHTYSGTYFNGRWNITNLVSGTYSDRGMSGSGGYSLNRTGQCEGDNGKDTHEVSYSLIDIVAVDSFGQ